MYVCVCMCYLYIKLHNLNHDCSVILKQGYVFTNCCVNSIEVLKYNKQ